MARKRLTVEQAATELGVSVRTVRRRIHTRELDAEKEKLAQGFRWWVLLDVPDAAASELASHDQDTTASRDAGAAALLAEVTAERDWLRVQVEELTRQAGNYQVLLLQSQEKIRLLEAGQAASRRVDNAGAVASQMATTTTTPARRPSRSFAQRLRRWLRGQ